MIARTNQSLESHTNISIALYPQFQHAKDKLASPFSHGVTAPLMGKQSVNLLFSQ